MNSFVLDEYEIGSALEAGEAAGLYLEQIRKTDLANLTDDEWREFLRTLFRSFEKVMRRKILNHEPPF